MSRTKTPRLDRKKGLYLKETPTKGRGVFCTTAIRKGEILETTPAIILTEKETECAEPTILNDYTFSIGAVSKKIRNQLKIKKVADISCVVMGIVSYCNHDEHPNAEVEWEETDGSIYYSLRATKNIPKNTEICTSYGESWFSDRPSLLGK